MSTPELIASTMAPLTGHNTTWTLKHDGQTIDVKLERGTRPVSIDNLDTGRQISPTSKRGQIIVAPVLDAYVARFGDDPTTPKEDTMTKETELNQHGDIVPSFHYSPDPGVIYANDVPVLDLPTLDAADDGYPERIITLAKDFVIDEHRGMDGETLSYTAVNDVFHPMHLQARTLEELLVRIVHTAYGLAAHEEFIFDMERIKREEDAQ